MSPTNTSSKPQRVHRQLLVSKCYVKDCRDPARHTVKRRWIHKIKPCIQNQVINLKNDYHNINKKKKKKRNKPLILIAGDN